MNATHPPATLRPRGPLSGAPLLLLPLALVAGLPGAVVAAPPGFLQRSIRHATRRLVRQQPAALSACELRGAVQETIIGRLKLQRLGRELTALKRAGIRAPRREVRAFVERAFDASLAAIARPDTWNELSAPRRFAVVARALKGGFAAERVIPDNWRQLDGAQRYEVVRALAANAAAEQAPAELAKWLAITGVKAPAGAKPITAIEALFALRTGGSAAAPQRYYGPETAKALENFTISGVRVPPDMIAAFADIKAAAAIANMRTGRLDRAIGGAIVKACREIKTGKFADAFVTDAIQGGAGTSTNMNANEVIAARASEILSGRIDYRVVHPNDHVNMAQSTNDTYPTAIRLTAYRRLEGLLDSYALLVKELRLKGKEYANLPKAARTHLQDAVPIMLGREFQAYAAVLGRDMRDIRSTMKGLLGVNMGGTAVGTRLNAEPGYVRTIAKTLAHVSGVPVHRSRDLVDATQNVDAVTRAHAMLKVSASNLIKISNDLRLMASGPRAGLGEIVLPTAQKGSSIMPGKVNPVIAEVVNQLSYQVQGNDLTVNLVAQNGQLELNQMEPVMAHNLFESIRILDRGARALAERGIRGLKANRENCLAGARNMLGLATALVPALGYDRAAALAKEALRTKRPLIEVVVQHGDLSPAQAAKVLDPARMARGGMVE